MKHTLFMNRCLQLARLGEGFVAPNPLVGCVVVYEGKIIGEGFHHQFGSSHAEVNAINSVKNKDQLRLSTLYVNLEPCSHFGKTPPCTDLIIKNKIPRVVIGSKDPFYKVNGSGMDRLTQQGVDVTVNVLENECRQVNRRFFVFHEKKRPYVLIKWAETTDGFIGRKDERIRITGSLSQRLVHRWRAQESAILVGTNTAQTDNPLLTCRKWFGKNPIRIVLDQHLRLSKTLNIFDTSAPTYIFNSIKDVEEKNLNYVKLVFDDHLIASILKMLHQNNILSVMVEGGSKLIDSFIQSGFWDEAVVFSNEKILNNGIKAPVFDHKPMEETTLGTDKFVRYRNINLVSGE